MFKKDMSSENERNHRLISFVGKVLESEWDTARQGELMSYVNVSAQYIKAVYSTYSSDTINFVMWGHEMRPKVEVGKFYLFFVEKHKDDQFYNLEYIYNNLCQTSGGKWIGPVDFFTKSNSSIQPAKLNFGKKLSYERYHKTYEGKIEEKYYDKRYFMFSGDSVYPSHGYYLAEIFKILRDGALTDRNYFGDYIEDSKIFPIKEVILEDIKSRTDTGKSE